ncbi:MAG: N-6 DNA methylase, partial [Bacteroidota bacterium]|nr:N-6 DNA methylase [Bacteroidota bacterium]
MPAPQIICDLVEQFERNIETYKRAQNETQVRREFIDPFFSELGWDMDNSKTKAAPQYQDVIHEDQLKISGSMKAPDYAFRIGGQRKFYVEAKKPSVWVKDDPAPALQVRTYAWNAKLDLSIVTDFEEFAVYECSSRPKRGDKPSVGRINYYTYKDYLEKWDEIAGIFSKDAVIQGSFDKYAAGSKGKRGTQTVDKAFLAEIENWRELLAKNFAKNNKITEEELKFATQRTLDRIIFLRICEARRIEEEGKLQEAVSGTNAYKNLFSLFQAADNRYNSGLFYFRKGDKAHTSESELDTITPKLKLDDKILKEIIGGLYYPSPYLFDVIPADILGQVYEQFLGKVIRMTSGGMVKIEEKPEVRKAGGVYYTPTYIVDYIVKNTVGKMLEEEKKEKPSLKILDPACGSGSFLLGAYNYLLHWYLGKHSKNAASLLKQKNSPIYEITSPSTGTPREGRGEGGGIYALTTSERKRILLEHIYGVDIDEQAVEVAKLNLMLKCLEGEAGTNLKLSVERILPDLSDNIKCGNSLIGPDFSDGLFSGEDKKINPFDWNAEFSGIMKKGGFDVVVGNPPYGKEAAKMGSNYFKEHFHVSEYQLNIYNLFVEQGYNLLRNEGSLGFIIPSAWVASKYDEIFRKYLYENTHIREMVIAPKQAFVEATVETCIVIVDKKRSGTSFKVQRWDVEPRKSYEILISDIAPANNHNFPIYSNVENIRLIRIIKEGKHKLSDYAQVSWGIKVYQKGKGRPKQEGFESNKRIFHSSTKTKKSQRLLLGGSNVGRYSLSLPDVYVDYGEWLAEPRTPDWFTGERLVVREVTSNGKINAAYVNNDFVFSNSVDGIRVIDKRVNIKAILGILNSKLIGFYLLNTSANAFKGAFPKVLLQDLRDLPLP